MTTEITELVAQKTSPASYITAAQAAADVLESTGVARIELCPGDHTRYDIIIVRTPWIVILSNIGPAVTLSWQPWDDPTTAVAELSDHPWTQEVLRRFLTELGGLVG